MKFSLSLKAPNVEKKGAVLPSNGCSKNLVEKDLGHQNRKPIHLHTFPGMELPVGTPWAQTQVDNKEWEPGLHMYVAITSKSSWTRKFRETSLRWWCLHYMSSSWQAFPGHTRSFTAAINTITHDTYLPQFSCPHHRGKNHIWGKSFCSMSRLKLLLWGGMKKSVSWHLLFWLIRAPSQQGIKAPI